MHNILGTFVVRNLRMVAARHLQQFSPNKYAPSYVEGRFRSWTLTVKFDSSAKAFALSSHLSAADIF